MDQRDVQIPEVAELAGSPEDSDAAKDQDQDDSRQPGPGPASQDRISHLKAACPGGLGEHGCNLPLTLKRHLNAPKAIFHRST